MTYTNKLNLSIDTMSSKSSKKYLGDPADPHYIPSSPLIERQALTFQEEVDLKRMCSLVLANVPHSDDMTDDPIAYLASQIQVREKPSPPAAKPKLTSFPKPPGHKFISAAVGTFKRDAEQTATPSESSKRDTFDQTDYSTPFTSAGITPVETTKRFPDLSQKNSGSKMTHGLRVVTPAGSKEKSASSTETKKSSDRKKPTADTDTVKRTLRLFSDSALYDESDSTSKASPLAKKNFRTARLSQPNLNKKLPPPPMERARTTDDKAQYSSPDTKSPSQSSMWLLQAIKKKRNAAVESEDMSRRKSESPAAREIDGRLSRHSAMALSSISPVDDSKKRFRLKLFKAHSPRRADVLVS